RWPAGVSQTSRRPRHETRQPVASGTQHETEVLDQVIVRFAGDSGDGMQLTGDRVTTSSALLGTVLIVNSDSFEERDLAKAGYAENPLTNGSLAAYTVYEVPMTSITQEVCKEAGVKPRDAERSKNFFALRLISWMYTRPIEPTVEWIAERFGGKPLVVDANTRAFRAGYDFGETAEL